MLILEGNGVKLFTGCVCMCMRVCVVVVVSNFLFSFDFGGYLGVGRWWFFY